MKRAASDELGTTAKRPATKPKRGTVMIAVKPPRGSGISFPARDGFSRVDVTSGSMNRIVKGRDAASSFSPMCLGPVRGAEVFENYWQVMHDTGSLADVITQYGKVFSTLGHLEGDGTPQGSKVTDKWRKFRDKGYKKAKGCRRPPEAKTSEVLEVREGRRKFKYLRPSFAHYQGQNMDYITSRKKVYAPVYAELVQKTEAFKVLKRRVDEGENVMIIDLVSMVPGDWPSQY